MAQKMDDVQPKPGDLIDISRGKFHHWAIYVGDDDVVHLTTPSAGDSSSTSVSNKRGIVTKEKLSDVVHGDKYCINNRMDDKYQARSVSDILKDAQSRVGQEPPYNVLQYNCEHFATELRYDKPDSQQVRDAVQEAAGVGAAAVIGVGLLAAAASPISGSRSNEQRNNQ